MSNIHFYYKRLNNENLEQKMKLKKQVKCNQKTHSCNQKTHKPIFNLLNSNNLQGQKTSNILFNIIIKEKSFNFLIY